jgi:uncharacterized protein
MRRSAGVLLSALALAGCGSSPKTHFYTLDPLPSRQPASSQRLDSPIVVGHVELPGELDRQALVTHGAGSTINVSDDDHWAAPLDELVRRAFSADLRTRLPPGSVLAPGDPTPKETRTLALNLRRFMADQSGHIALDADWTVQGRGAPAAPQRATVEINAGGNSGDAITAGMSQALAKLADQVAAKL